MHSAVQVSQPLHLVDLSSVPLRRLGVTSKQLIDTEKDQCPASRKWAEATLRHYPDVQWLSWVSGQMTRHVRWCFSVTGFLRVRSIRRGASRSLTEDSAVFDTVLDLADLIGRHHRGKN